MKISKHKFAILGITISAWAFQAMIGALSATPSVANEFPAEGSVYQVYPTGTELDFYNLQAAIAAAQPGDTVLLKSGTFTLTAYGPDDIEVVTTPGRGFANYISTMWSFIPGTVLPDGQVFQILEVDKPLTILGEAGTTIAGLLGFVVDSLEPGVKFENLRFEEMQFAIHVMTAGVAIDGCEFDNCDHSLLLYIDDYSAYPGYPEDLTPRANSRSFVRGCTFLSVPFALNLYGSEVEVSNCQFLNEEQGVVAIDLGGMRDAFQPGEYLHSIRDNYHLELCRNNLLQDNYVERAVHAISHMGHGGTDSHNIIRRNTIVNCARGIENYLGPSFGHVIEDNTITGAGLLGILLQHVEDVQVRGNQVSGCYRNVWGFAAIGCTIEENEFLDSTFQSVAMFGGGSRDNVIRDNLVTTQPFGWDGIILTQTSNCEVTGNEVRDYYSGTWFAAPVRLYATTSTLVKHNTFVNTPGGWAAITVVAGSNNNKVLGNDYSASNKPGYAEYDSDGNLIYTGGDPCVVLGEDTFGNRVNESLSPTGRTFPLGASLCTQVLDYTDDFSTLPYDGANSIAGRDPEDGDACVDNPNWGGILQHLLDNASDEEAEAALEAGSAEEE